MNILWKKVLNLNRNVKIVLVLLFFLYYFGVFTILLETSYSELDKDNDENILKYIIQLDNNKRPDKPPINYYNYSFSISCDKKCDVSFEYYHLRLVYIVKSAADHFDQREAIRKSWGFERRFSDVPIRTVFILGLTLDENIQEKINNESLSRGDIVQANFIDSYFNNTIKTMMGFKWAITYCNHSKFYFFSDDDMYVSTKNVLRFLRNPLEYPNYLLVPVASSVSSKKELRSVHRQLAQVFDIELPEDAELFAGYMFPNSRPHRHLSSKWYISLSEYPYSRFPPYLTAGAYTTSNKALKKLYYASFYTKHFRFDDIFLAMLARHSNIVPLHNDEFYFYKKPYSITGYKYVIAVHGFDNPQELLHVWNEQKTYGHA